MWIDYPSLIEQTVDELVSIECRLSHQRSADRVKLLRLLKSGTVRSLRAAAPLLGYSDRHMQRWWHTYTSKGLEALCTLGPYLGPPERVSADAVIALKVAMRDGQITRLRDAQTFLREHFNIVYDSLNGISQLFKRHQIKLKTGHRTHRQGNPQTQVVFKK